MQGFAVIQVVSSQGGAIRVPALLVLAGICLFAKRQRNIQRIIIVSLFSFVIALQTVLAGPASSQADDGLDEVVLHLKWTHQFQFAGFYAALEKGFYEQAGLDVTITEGGPGVDFIEEVVSGKAQYGVELPDLLLRRAKGVPVVVLACIYQHSPLALVSLAESNIHTPKDLIGRKVMLTATDVDLRAMITLKGVDLDAIEIIEHTFRTDDLTEGRIDARSMYVTDIDALLTSRGIACNTMVPYSYGVDFYGDCLFTAENEINQHPERVKAFRAASLKGWEYAMDHPEELAELIHHKYAPQHSFESLLAEAKQMNPLLLHRVVEVGHINPRRWEDIRKTFVELGMLDPEFSLEGFLYDPYAEPQMPTEPEIMLTPQEQDWLKNRKGVVTLAIDNTYPPLNYLNDKGELVGANVDYIRLMGQRLGIHIVFEGSTWPKAIEKALAHEVDGVVNASVIEERKPYLYFSKPYGIYPQGLLTRDDEPSIENLSTFSGRKVAAKIDSAQLAYLRDRHPDITLVGIKTLSEGYTLLLQKEVDGIFDDVAVMYHETAKRHLRNLKFSYIDEEIEIGRAHIGVNSDEPLLLTILNKGVESLTEKDHESIQNKSLWANLSGDQTAGKMTIALSPEEKVWLAEHPVIRLGESTELAPFLIQDDSGQFKGFSVDLFSLIAERLSVEFEIINDTWTGCFRKIQSGEIDIIGMISGVAADELGLIKSQRHVDFPATVYGKRDSGLVINSLADLKGLRVSCFKDILFLRKYLETRKNELTIIDSESVLGALRLVAEGKADVMLGMSSDSYYFATEFLPNIQPLHVSQTLRAEDVCGIRADWPQFVGIINKALDSIPPSEIAQILDKWNIQPQVVIDLTAEERTWLAEHPKIRIGLDPDFAPYSFLDKNGNFQGACYEFMTRLESILGIDIEPVSDLGWKEIQQQARAGNLDVITPAIITDERKEYLVFSEMYLPTPLVITCRVDDNRFQSAQDLVGQRVAVAEGYASSKKVILEYPGIIQVPVATPLEALQIVSAGSADAYVCNIGVNVHLAIKHGIANLKVAAAYEKEMSGQHFGIRSDWPELVPIFDKALAAIPDREKLSILQKWVPVSLPAQEVPSVVLSDEEKAWLAEHPVVPMLVDYDAVPFSIFNEQGQLIGVLGDICRQLESMLGIQFSYEGVEYGDLAEHAKKADRDIITGLDPLDVPSLEDNYLKTRDMMYLPFALFALDDSDLFRHGSDALSGKKIALIEGWDLAHPALEPFKDCEFVVVESVWDCINLVLRGEADGYYEVFSIVNNVLSDYSISNIRAVQIYPYGQPYNILVKKEWPLFYSALSKALDTFDEQEIIGLLQKWNAYLDDPAYRLFSTILTKQERQWLTDHPVIRVASDPYWAPMEFRDTEGQFRGMAMDYLKDLEKMLGVRFESVPDLSWGELTEGVKKRDIDMFSCVAPTPSRREYVNFTEPYLTIPVAIFAGSDVGYIRDLGELKGRKVAVVAEYAIEEWVSLDHPDMELITFETAPEALEALREGDVYAFVGDIATTAYYIGRQKMVDVKVAGDTSYEYVLSMATRNDWPMLQGILQKALDVIPVERHNAINRKWQTVEYEHRFDYMRLWRVLAVVAAVIVAVFCWNIVLRKTVSRRTRELKVSEQRLKVLFEQAADAVWIIALDGHIERVNEQACQSTGYTQSELLSMSIVSVDADVNTLKVLRELTEKVTPHHPVILESHHRRKNGSVFPVEIMIAYLDTPDGPRMMGIARDITERKQAEEALRKSEAQQRRILDTMKEGLAIVAKDGKYLYVNAALSQMYQYSREELLNMGVFDTIHPDYHHVFDRYIRDITEKEYFSGEVVEVRKDGIPLNIEVRGAPIQYEGQSCFLAIVRDITESKQAEEALKESEERYRNAIQLSFQGIVRWEFKKPLPIELPFDDQVNWLLDNAYVAECNEAYAKMLGHVNSEELTGASLAKVVHSEQTARKIAELFVSHNYTWKNVETAGEIFTVADRHHLNNVVSIIVDNKVVRVWTMILDITELKQAEAALTESEERYRLLFESANEGIFILDPDDGTFVDCNPSACQQLGCSREQVVGQSPVRFSPEFQPDEKKSSLKARELIEKAYHGQPQSFEWKHIKYDGTPFDAEVVLNRLQLPDKVYVQALLHDITERKAIEQEREGLLQQLQFTQFAFDHAGEAAHWIHRDQKFVYVNEMSCQMHGYTRDELLRMSLPDIDPFYTSKDWDLHWDKLRQQGTKQFEGRHKRKDGTVFPVEIISKFVTYEGKEYICSFERDITERKAAEKALQDSEKKLHAIFDHHYQLTGLLDPEGRLLAANKTVLDFTESSESDLVGIHLWEGPWWNPAQEHEIEELVERAAAGEFIRIETTHVNKDGQVRDFDFSLSPVKDDNGNVVYIVPEGRDITDIKQAEEAIRRVQEEIAHMSRVVTVGEIASGLAHEINQPLCATENYANACLRMIRSKQVDQNEMENCLEQISKLTQSSGEIINRIKGMVKKREIQKTAIVVRDILQQAVSILSYQINKNHINVVYNQEQEDVWILADFVMIEQVVLNLLRNSIEAMSESTVRNRVLTLSTAINGDGSAEISVADTGTGISPEHSTRIFDPFFTLKKEGMGVGLAISRTIVKMHSGEIWVVQNPKGGTIMKFTLPLARRSNDEN